MTSRPDGTPAKDVLPWTHGRRVWTDRKGNAQDRIGWHCKAPPTPRPLYGLDRLAARPAAPALVCEGEKTADAAGLLFPDTSASLRRVAARRRASRTGRRCKAGG